eukprot:583271-Pelagomonas_calceolata.AAC.2
MLVASGVSPEGLRLCAPPTLAFVALAPLLPNLCACVPACAPPCERLGLCASEADLSPRTRTCCEPGKKLRHTSKALPLESCPCIADWVLSGCLGWLGPCKPLFCCRSMAPNAGAGAVLLPVLSCRPPFKPHSLSGIAAATAAASAAAASAAAAARAFAKAGFGLITARSEGDKGRGEGGCSVHDSMCALQRELGPEFGAVWGRSTVLPDNAPVS